jgi:hypothetical protein
MDRSLWKKELGEREAAEETLTVTQYRCKRRSSFSKDTQATRGFSNVVAQVPAYE